MRIEFLIEPEDVLTTEMNEIRGGKDAPVIHCNSDGVVHVGDAVAESVAVNIF
jgi:hypothetical protein